MIQYFVYDVDEILLQSKNYITYTNHVIDTDDVTLDIRSEIDELAILLHKTDVSPNSTEWSNLKQLEQHSELHPSLVSISLKPVFGLLALIKVNVLQQVKDWLFSDKLVKTLKHLYIEREQDMLFENLKKCNKVALILPEYKCKVYARKLRTLGLHSDVAKSAFTTSHIGLSFEGVLPLDVLQRCRYLQESGVITWLTNLTGQENIPPVINFPTRPNMTGNIFKKFIIYTRGAFLL